MTSLTWRRSLRFHSEAMLARLALALLRALGPVTASNLGGAVCRTVGPLLAASRIAETNLRHALPELDPPARRRIIHGVWDNLGRTVAELPHLPDLHRTAHGPGWEMVGEEIVRAQALRGGPLVFVSAHFGNWELLPRAAAACGLPCASFYRTASNPVTNRIIADLRTSAVGADMPAFSKGASGARGALAYLARGGAVAMLVDQKMNEGIEARLFGHPVMTPVAAAAFALRFRCPVIAAHVERLGPARFRVLVDAPLDLPATGDRHADIAALTQAINDRLEQWVRAQPESWLWLHRRFPKEVYRR
ncbi:Lipid A biosynthesis lauroyl acyltransferase [Rhodovastum atsumiense]|uniref:Lauroyl acyltransferase n=1 Tax=Rhodovastum atsumiense TaxID=504468 RepID=A0A5M6IQR2_9PROT|nr:lauroyl acyltransferase [Rhodovastum atsumiense]KAA5610612.1 lauroyl acyltransferase [Rhodovastum atsumiense]CAH2600731.1 Lipid A biosynthesis lauroyl acyltransferase [Rhodovastum atsumiense]